MNLGAASVSSGSSVVNSFTTEDTEKISFLGLGSNDVHVWRVALNQNPDGLPGLSALLSADERERAARFHFDKDRNQFIQSRAALRRILAEYLNVSPKEIEFVYGAHGKPALAGRFAEGKLRFSLSRRDGLAVIAVAYGREIGVDVELIRSDVPVMKVADTIFSPAESATLWGLPEDLRVEAFYNCWTRKEAYVKARGEGLSFPLKRFDVSLAPGEAAQLLDVRDDDTEADRWTLRELPVGDGYVAAIAIEGTNANLSMMTCARTFCGFAAATVR